MPSKDPKTKEIYLMVDDTQDILSKYIMDNQEQVRFVNDLCNNIRDGIIDKILLGKIPEKWDGHELRTWLAAKFKDSAEVSKGVMRGKRLKEYNNTVIINNL